LKSFFFNNIISNSMATHQKKHIKNTGIKSKELVVKQQGEDYAEVLKAVGSDARFSCNIFDVNKEVTAKLAGRLIKGPHKQRIVVGDLVLLQLDTSTSDKKYFIIHKYSPGDKKQLAKNGEFKHITSTETVGETVVAMEDEVTNTTTVNQEVDEDFIDDI